MWHSLKAANVLAPNAGVCKKGNSTDEILNGQQRELKEELVVETMVATNLDAIHPQANYCHHAAPAADGEIQIGETLRRRHSALHAAVESILERNALREMPNATTVSARDTSMHSAIQDQT